MTVVQVNGSFVMSQAIINNNISHALLHAVQQEIFSRLELVALKPKRILAESSDDLKARYPDAEMVSMADKADSVDLIISNLCLPWCSDVEVLFRVLRRLFRPEGLLIFTSLGPSTLSDIDHQQHFVDMHNVGDALLKTGFSDPVLDVEHFEIKYQDKRQVLSDLEKMGIAEVHQPPLSLSYEVVYGHTWCPAVKDEFLADPDGVVKIPLAALRARLRQ